MAEGGVTESSWNVNEYGLLPNEINEEELQEESQGERQHKVKINAFCDVCLVKNLIALTKNVAFYLCFVCEKYLCYECFKGHESHNCVKLVSEENERDEKIKSFLDEMKNEIQREEKFEREIVSMVDRVNMKHRLDEGECWINGLCGLNNTSWVVADEFNSCIKIFNVGSNLLQRYIRLGSNPYDLTEVKVKSKFSGQAVVSSDFKVKKLKPLKRILGAFKSLFSTGGISLTNRRESFLLAVTSPWKRIILIIDVTQNPAVITKTIKTEKQCHSIESSEGNLVTLCRDELPDVYRWFISVISLDGIIIQTINTDIQSWSYPHLAVSSGGFYITDPKNNDLLCLNNEGELVSHNTSIRRSLPAGMSVDPDMDQVYVCCFLDKNIYRLDSGLESLETLFDLMSVNPTMPEAYFATSNEICFHRDKLFVTPFGSNSVVTVVRVL